MMTTRPGRVSTLLAAALAAAALLAVRGPVAARGDGPTIGAEEFARRRAALAERLESGLFAILDLPIVRGDVDALDGNTPKYDFFYLTGWERAGSVLLLRCDTKESALFVPAGTKPSKSLAKKLGVDRVLPRSALLKLATAWSKETGAPLWLREKGPAGREWVELWSKSGGFRERRDVAGNIRDLRLVKSGAELEVMRAVGKLGAEGLNKVIPKIRPGVNEGAVAAAIEKVYRKGGARRLSFPSIVGSGKNGATIHYTKNSEVMRAGDLVVLDVGAELHHYASDITRTVPVSGRFTVRQREIYQAVLDAQLAAEKTLEPGTTLRDLDRIAKQVITDRGFPRIPHHVGHYVGLAVHDSGRYDDRLEPGMIITIEPGIYLAGEGVGVRIEDMYLVTEDGYERLSADVPRTIDGIEALRGAR